MRITILTLFPEMFEGFLNTSIIARAIKKEQVVIETINFRDYTLNKHRKVDDYPYGGAPGLVLMVQPLADAIKALRTERCRVIMITPEGKPFVQEKAREMAFSEEYDHYILICGHYEGFDGRIDHYIDEKISIGDYILTGGEIPAMAITDAIVRLLPGVIRKSSSNDESFEDGLLECPQYTMPEVYDGYRVPEILLSGHHAKIRRWRLKESLRRTKNERPDLLENRRMRDEEIQLLDEILIEEKNGSEEK